MSRILFWVALIFSMYQKTAQAEVWHSNQVWNSYWENEYKEWVRTSLKTNLFTSGDGLLGGLSADCADILYAIRIKFAYEHSLPFMINAPDVLRSKMKYFGSNTTMFDSITNERARVRAFIKFIMEECGTSSLFIDTYPVQIKKIDSGIVYVVEWSLFGKVQRHSYIIKGFNEDRELLYYAGDAPPKVRKLQIDTKYPRFSYSEAPFGFRKWKHPEHLSMLEKNIPKEDEYGNDQYVLLSKVGKKRILKEIHQILKNQEGSI